MARATKGNARNGNINTAAGGTISTQSATNKTNNVKKQKFVIVRCRDAGVHAGALVSNRGRNVVLKDSIRIWYWSGAASLSELAVYGPKNKAECKFGVPVREIALLEACEIIACEPEAEKSIKGVPSWRA